MSLSSIPSVYQVHSNHEFSYEQIKGFRIGKACRIAFHSLTILAAAATVAAFAATVLTGTLPITVLIVTSVAFGILGTVQGTRFIKPYLPKQIQHFINVLKASVVDLLAIPAMALIYPVKQSWFDPKKGDSEQTPILLVHGYLHNSSGWIYHRYQYKQAGFTNIFTVDLGHPLHSIEEYSKVVQKKIEEIQEKTGRNDVKLVGHSMGGVVSAHYALNHAQPDGIEVKDLITLGSPLMGTKIAPIGVGKCTDEMNFASEYISDLSKKLADSSIPHFHQGSKADMVILPYRSSLNNQNNQNTLLHDDLGHLSLMLSDRVVSANISRLRQIQVAQAV